MRIIKFHQSRYTGLGTLFLKFHSIDIYLHSRKLHAFLLILGPKILQHLIIQSPYHTVLNQGILCSEIVDRIHKHYLFKVYFHYFIVKSCYSYTIYVFWICVTFLILSCDMDEILIKTQVKGMLLKVPRLPKCKPY